MNRRDDLRTAVQYAVVIFALVGLVLLLALAGGVEQGVWGP